MLYFLTALLAGLMFHPKAGNLPRRTPVDPRSTKLEMFFDRYQCPQPHYSFFYLKAADAYSLDYRLIPAISVRESTCGQYGPLNNRWGWDSGFTGFSSVPQGIEFVAYKLAQGRKYQGRPVGRKLVTYNPDPSYAMQVKHLMREIDATP